MQSQASVLLWSIGVAAAVGAAALPAMAQNDADLIQRLERQMRHIDSSYRLAVPADQPISERLLFDYGGSVRFGFFAVDNQFGTTRMLRQTDGLVYVRGELDGTHRFYGRLRFLYNDFSANDSFDGRGDEWGVPFGDRYWYEFNSAGAHRAKTGEHPDAGVRVKVGRQFIHWGSGLTLSDDIYAALVDVEWKDLALTGLVGLTPSTGTIDFDGSRPGFDSDTDRMFYGGKLEYRGFANHRPYIFVLVQRDHNERDSFTFETPVFDYPTDFEYDSEYWAIGSRGTLGPQIVYRAELVYQTGSGLSSSFDTSTGLPITQTDEDVEAWAGILTYMFLARDEADTRYELEFLAASGDTDRLDPSDTFGGNASGSTDHAFNSLGYVNTGLALAPEISNLLMLRLGASTSPHVPGLRKDALRVGVNGFLYAKADQSAPLNFRTEDNMWVGGEVDFALDWRITSDLNFSARYGIFIPGRAMLPGRDDPRHFVYAGVTYAF